MDITNTTSTEIQNRLPILPPVIGHDGTADRCPLAHTLGTETLGRRAARCLRRACSVSSGLRPRGPSAPPDAGPHPLPEHVALSQRGGVARPPDRGVHRPGRGLPPAP